MTVTAGRAGQLRSVLRLLDRHRRLAAALCAAGSIGAAMSVVAPPPPRTTAVLAAARDLPAGHPLTATDVTSLALPPGAVPAGALTTADQAVGRSAALPVRRGEVLTDVRLSGSALLADVTAGALVAAPVRIADPAAVALLRAGDRVDVLGAHEGLDQAAVVAADVLVVAVPDPAAARDSPALEGGALVVVVTSAETSRRLAQAAVVSRLSVVLRR
ncbi:MAG: pilus assembly protein CpaB [Frankiaceae bacterium]|nr:pilus assembly protein CpaB [Frankiaceae bacterium]